MFAFKAIRLLGDKARRGKNCGFGRILPAFTPYTLHYTLKNKVLNMKKVYMAPQTEAIELLGENAIMVGSSLIIGSGDGESGGMG